MLCNVPYGAVSLLGRCCQDQCVQLVRRGAAVVGKCKAMSKQGRALNCPDSRDIFCSRGKLVARAVHGASFQMAKDA